MLTLVFDTETTGLPSNHLPDDHCSQPGICQIGAILYRDRKVVSEINLVVIPRLKDRCRLLIPEDATAIHGIDDELVEVAGIEPSAALRIFELLFEKCDRAIAFNSSFDTRLIEILATRSARPTREIAPKPVCCAMLTAAPVLAIPGKYGQFAWPKLQAAYKTLVNPEGFDGAHDAMADVRATAEVVWALEDHGVELHQTHVSWRP